MKLLAYYELKAAQALFSTGCASLDETQRRRVHSVAQRYADIEAAVLASDEAGGVCIEPGALAAALREIRERYDDAEAFAADLAAAGLQVAELESALRRELLVNAVLDRVGAAAGEVGEVEAEIFYYTHLDRFLTPERRVARHILVTINDDFADNRRERAQQRIGEIAARVAAKPERFEEQAVKHSECPTALNGGLLGELPRGQLYPELDAVLFALAAGETSAPVESQLGFHVIRCDEILPERTLPFAEVSASLRKRLGEERARKHSRQWLDRLLAQRSVAS